MDDTPEIAALRQELEAIAKHLDQARETILTTWRQMADAAEDVSTSTSLTRTQFDDHIPLMLDLLTRRLRRWPHTESPEEAQKVRQHEIEHGAQRWQQGYQLPELLCEWGHLQMALVTALNDSGQAHPEIGPRAMDIARDILLRLCIKSINSATAQYWRLHQTEAASRVKDLEQALETLSQLEQDRAQAWREAAHDLRGSMSVVQGTSNELESEDLTDSMRQEFYGMMQTGMRSIQTILSDLMFLARLDAGHEDRELSDFDVARVLREFCHNTVPLAQQRGLYLRVDGPESLPVVGDRAKILRIVQNLLLNSLKYTRAGGVTIIWSIVDDPDTDNWVFCVQDTGPGLEDCSPMLQELHKATRSRNLLEQESPQSNQKQAPTVAAQSCQPTAPQSGGEGIGLSIVKRLCEMLDASLELESRAGQGSTFRITLPRSYADT